jgi:HD-GYP domain-containing protein (c-di-GMP phosphodiesterase class II)
VINQFDPFGQGLNLLGNLEDEVVVEMEELSRRFINSLFVLIRSSWLYGLDNDALKNAQQSFCLLFDEYTSRGQEVIELQLRDETFFLNGDLIKLDFTAYKSAQKLEKLFSVFQIDQLVFPLPVTPSQLSNFSEVLSKVAHSNQSFSNIAQDCLPIAVALLGKNKTIETKSSQDPRLMVLRLYSHSLTVLKNFVDDLRRGLRPKYSRIKRLCLKLMSLDQKYLNLLLATVQIQSIKGRLYAHMLNTAIICIVFGKRIGMSKSELLDLGMTAFYQNLSWALVNQVHRDADGASLETIQEIEAYRISNQAEMSEIRNHIAHLLLMIGGFNTKIISRLIVAYETQIATDDEIDTLYLADIDVNFLTEIVTMASSYDHMTHHENPRTSGLRSDEIMKTVMRHNPRVDTFVSELFGSALGVYPIGSLVELGGGDLAIVFDLPSSLEHQNRPRVKLVADRTGNLVEDGSVIDLAERDVRGGYIRSIEHVLNGADFGLSVSSLFFAQTEHVQT